MRWALHNGEKFEAVKGAQGCCPTCGDRLIPKCGQVNVSHWAHKAGDCDPWYEPETEWHLSWKARFPKEQQEVTIGKHRADVKTPHCVIELQHSPISVEEIREREEFYGNMVWIFDCQEQYKKDQIRDGSERGTAYYREIDTAPYRETGRFHHLTWKWMKKSIMSCKRPVILQLLPLRLMNIFAFDPKGCGYGIWVDEETFFEEVNGKLGSPDSTIVSPDYVIPPEWMNKRDWYGR